jgi:hypothetical protein
VVDEEAGADLRSRVDIYPRLGVRDVADQARDERLS